MSKRRLVITAVLAGSSQSEVARTYGVSQSWLSRLMARYAAEGEAAFEPRSRRPRTSPRATSPDTVELVLPIERGRCVATRRVHAHTQRANGPCWTLRVLFTLKGSWRTLRRDPLLALLPTPDEVVEPTARQQKDAAERHTEKPNASHLETNLAQKRTRSQLHRAALHAGAAKFAP